MADLDDETVERVRRWCAEAGRHAGEAEIRAALGSLGWDELLNVRALLADPPPARPLGPAALADLARGTAADVAAEREREGRYQAPPPDPSPPGAREREEKPTPSAAKRGRGSKGRPALPVVHRKRDLAPEAPPPSPPLPPLDELRLPSGRAVLERLLREHGARRPYLLAALAGWRRPDGTAPDDRDLTALLDHHGLARAFAHRERDELLHALRAARGDRAAAAQRVGLPPDGFQAALDRLGASADAERIREARRTELRAHGTLAERVRLLAQDSERLADLGLLAEMEADLVARLPEHLRALGAGPPRDSLAAAFALSVALPQSDAIALARRLGLDLGRTDPAVPRAPRDRRPGPRRTAPRGPRPGPRTTAPRDPRPGSRRTAPRDPRPGPRRTAARPGGAPGQRRAPRDRRPGKR